MVSGSSNSIAGCLCNRFDFYGGGFTANSGYERALLASHQKTQLSVRGAASAV